MNKNVVHWEHIQLPLGPQNGKRLLSLHGKKSKIQNLSHVPLSRSICAVVLCLNLGPFQLNSSQCRTPVLPHCHSATQSQSLTPTWCHFLSPYLAACLCALRMSAFLFLFLWHCFVLCESILASWSWFCPSHIHLPCSGCSCF